MEFLYTLDNPLLVRSKKLRGPEQFAGPGATELQLLLLVYTQEVDILSVVQVTFELSGPTVGAGATVSHYPAVHTDLWTYSYLPLVCPMRFGEDGGRAPFHTLALGGWGVGGGGGSQPPNPPTGPAHPPTYPPPTLLKYRCPFFLLVLVTVVACFVPVVLLYRVSMYSSCGLFAFADILKKAWHPRCSLQCGDCWSVVVVLCAPKASSAPLKTQHHWWGGGGWTPHPPPPFKGALGVSRGDSPSRVSVPVLLLGIRTWAEF